MLEFWVRVHRDPAAVVAHRQPVVRFQRHLDEAGVAGHRLVHRVVQQLRRQVVQRRLVGAADIHARPAADRLQPLQDLDILGGVTLRALATEQIVHAVFLSCCRHPTGRCGVRATIAAVRPASIATKAGVGRRLGGGIDHPLRGQETAARQSCWHPAQPGFRRSSCCRVGAIRGNLSTLMARAVGFEPTTNRLTADCSTAELRPTSGRARI